MLKYAKIINDNTKECKIGYGTDEKFYESFGMTKMNVEQSYNGNWYLEGYAPQKSVEQQQLEIRTIRNIYLEKYVDPYQLVIRWNALSIEEQNNIMKYRKYLLDYTKKENWWESKPLTFDEWIES